MGERIADVVPKLDGYLFPSSQEWLELIRPVEERISSRITLHQAASRITILG